MKVSVAMPVYNVEKYIRECIDSVLSQTLKDFELIVVDDGSTDNSGKILDEYQKMDSRITVIHKKNEGVSIARNCAVEKCTGEYVFIMDSDDYIEKDALEKMYNEAVRTGADVVITDHCRFLTSEKQEDCHFFPENFVTEDREIILKLQKMVLHKGYSPYPSNESQGIGIGGICTKIIKREFIEKYQLKFDPYVKGVFDDCLFALNVFEHASKVAYIRVITYHIRILSTSLTHRFRPNQLEVYDRIYDKIQEFEKKYHKGDDFREAYYARVILYFKLSFRTYFFNKEYKGTRKKNYIEFINTINNNIYGTAFKKVNIRILDKDQQRIVILSRCKLNWLIWLICTFKSNVLKR